MLIGMAGNGHDISPVNGRGRASAANSLGPTLAPLVFQVSIQAPKDPVRDPVVGVVNYSEIRGCHRPTKVGNLPSWRPAITRLIGRARGNSRIGCGVLPERARKNRHGKIARNDGLIDGLRNCRCCRPDQAILLRAKHPLAQPVFSRREVNFEVQLTIVLSCGP